ncbi:hypothetical protein [Fulvimarina sp. MAC3]|uniref:hypothetical protein n=1 Tax=Fulvimarina sp. MAC3 TaxID=3148887 RepID=UPI0031FC2E2E
MFLDEKNEWHPPEPARQPPRPSLSRSDKAVLGVVVFNVLLLCFAPMGLVLVPMAIDAALAAFGG